MTPGDHNIDITRNIKTIEWLKSELLMTIASLYESLLRGVNGSQDVLVDVLANIILVTYVLGKRLGIPFSRIDMKIDDKIKLGILEKHKIEDWHGDLSELKQYLDGNRK
ncbi:MazG-like family protein [Marinisporobacter balticus]|uniref:MazG-like nucleotide pyrophosphohydrolase family protein n=1 Tax=Marinisporobacter balticus TaxID=2018667 RepID=A0A4R2L283_9FIRM|nr:MazG-like family protein [Marinisporobacter balticus]TCO77989.1 MazG-like nucleotide pyrophosphohydrolase family protein [Marinisporobacter balticus]